MITYEDISKFSTRVCREHGSFFPAWPIEVRIAFTTLKSDCDSYNGHYNSAHIFLKEELRLRIENIISKHCE